MGIDGIGKGGAPPSPTAGEASAPRASDGRAVDRPFEVHSPKTEAARVDGTAGTEGATAIQQLHAGKIDVERYVDLKVEEATAHLHGLGEGQIRELKAMLRAQVASDPALADLVTQVAGQAPKTPEE